MTKNKQKTRKKMRTEIVQKLYEIDINEGQAEFINEESFVRDGVLGVTENQDTIDKVIIDNLTGWHLKRLTYIDRAIIRFATYELKYTNTAVEIVINEALNLTRKFSDEGNDKMVGFTNKVLDNIKNSLKK
ncbi:MAG: transcription antitermination factor NusB [Candidatus Izimaplasma sp.]|nr:transcription antitermination factor NusB [Candidatus Izimaplasma bacterium]